MPKYLKTQAECVGCGTPTPIRSMAERERARCQRCAETQRLLRCAAYADDAASRALRDAKGKSGPAWVAAHLHAAAKRMGAAARVAEAIASGMVEYAPMLERRWAAWALARARWAQETTANLEPHLVKLRDAVGPGLVAIPGEGGLPEAPTEERPELHLLVRVETET